MEGLLRYLRPIREEGPADLDRLAAWCAVNSGSTHREGLDRMRHELEEAFRILPAEGERIPLPSGDALHYRCRPGAERQVLLCGHYDTVYPAEHPFQAVTRLDGRRWRGPGIADMKGGLLVLLAALRAFESFPEAGRLGWEVLLTPDEERGSPESAPLLQAAARRCHLGLVFEPALQGSGELARRRPGSANYEALARGRSAHVGRDFPSGRNAIAGLGEAIAVLDALNRPPEFICNVGRIEGGGPANVVPAEARALFNFRAHDPALVEEALVRAASAARESHGVEIAWEGGFTRPPKHLTPEIERLFARFQACAEALGFPLGWRDTPGCCDGNNLAAAGLPNLDSLGVRGGNLHTPEEFVETDSLVERASLSALFLMDLALNPL